MLLLELIDWALDNPGDATLGGILLLIIRKVVLWEIESVVQMGRDEELIWTRERVEELTGQHWNGPRPILQRAKIQYTVNYYKYLLGASRWGDLLRRIKGMNQAVNYSVLFLAVVSALKLILQPFGIDLTELTDERVNAIANGFAALMTIIGIVRNNLKGGAPRESGYTTESSK